MFKSYPMENVEIKEPTHLTEDDALVFMMNAPLEHDYWSVSGYELDPLDKKIPLSNYISIGNYFNTDVDDCICVILTPNKVLFKTITDKINKNKYGSHLIKFIPIYHKYKEYSKYWFDIIGLNNENCYGKLNYNIKKYTINDALFIKPEIKNIIDIYNPDRIINFSKDYTRHKEQHYISDFDEMSKKLVIYKNYKILYELNVDFVKHEQGSDITKFKCIIPDDFKRSMIAVICLDHSMTKKSNYSYINFFYSDKTNELIPTGNIFNRNINIFWNNHN